MRILINLDENIYVRLFDCGIRDEDMNGRDIHDICIAVRNGTILPEGHSDLFDKDDFFGKYPELAIEPYINENAVIPADLGNIK